MRGACRWPAKAVFLSLYSAIILTLFGCAVHYYDEKTQTEHLWGFGHMKMKASAPNEELKATVSQTDILGFGVSKSEDDFSLIGGLSQKKHLDVVDENTAVRLEWPDNSIFNVRIGSKPPFETEKDEK